MKFSAGSVGGLSTTNIIGIVAKDLKSLGIYNSRDGQIFIANLVPQNGNLNNNDFRQLDPLLNDKKLAQEIYNGNREGDFKLWTATMLVFLFLFGWIEIGLAQTLGMIVRFFNWPLANFILLFGFATFYFYVRWPFRAWHGAEHMACNALMKGQYASVEDVAKQSRTASYCGTNKLALIILSGQIATLCAILLPSPAILWQIMLIQFIGESYDWMLTDVIFFVTSEILVGPISRMLQFLFATRRPEKVHLDLAYAVLTDLVKKLESQKAMAKPFIDKATRLMPKIGDGWRQLAIQDIIDEAKDSCPSRSEIDFLIELVDNNKFNTKLSGATKDALSHLFTISDSLKEKIEDLQKKTEELSNNTHDKQ